MLHCYMLAYWSELCPCFFAKNVTRQPDLHLSVDVVVVVAVVVVGGGGGGGVVVFTLNCSFYPTTSAVPPVSFLILHPRDIQVQWSQTVRQRKTIR